MALLLAAPARILPAQIQQELVIRGLKFQGAKSIDSEILAASIRTTNSSWFVTTPIVRKLGFGQRRYFNQRDFQADVLRIAALYRRNGFPDVVVDTTVERSPESVKLTFRIT